MKILIRNGRVIDPASGRDEVTDLAIASGRIVGIGPNHDFQAERTIDASGLVTHDNPGEYHAQFALTTGGVWHYRGRGTTTTGDPIAATPRISLLAS